jgi:hypothetical protein
VDLPHFQQVVLAIGVIFQHNKGVEWVNFKELDSFFYKVSKQLKIRGHGSSHFKFAVEALQAQAVVFAQKGRKSLQFRVTKKDVEDVLSGNVFDKLFKSNFMF